MYMKGESMTGRFAPLLLATLTCLVCFGFDVPRKSHAGHSPAHKALDYMKRAEKARKLGGECGARNDQDGAWRYFGIEVSYSYQALAELEKADEKTP